MSNQEAFVTKAEVQQMLQDFENRLLKHIDEVITRLDNKRESQTVAQVAESRTLNKKTSELRREFEEFRAHVNQMASTVEKAIVPVQNVEIAITTQSHTLQDLLRRTSDLSNRIEFIDNDINQNLRPQVSDIESRSSLTIETVNAAKRQSQNALENAERTAREVEGIKNSIDSLNKRLNPYLDFIEKRMALEERLFSFFSSWFGKLAVGTGISAVALDTLVSLFRFIFG